jgi:arylsulfatase
MRLRASLVAVLSAALASTLFEVLCQAVFGRLPPLGYPLLQLLLALGAAAGIGLASGLTRIGVELGLAAWAGWSGLAAAGPAVAAGLAAATFVVLVASRAFATSAWVRGAVVALALVLVLEVWNRLLERSPLPSTGTAAVASSIALYAVLLALLCGQGVLAARRRLPSPVWTCATVAALLAVAAGVADRVRPSLHPPDYAGAPDPEAPSVIVLILDTVRADHMSLYGYRRDTTPRLDAFVRASDRARVFPLAYTPASWTVPAHASLFTGLLPSQHGVHEGAMHRDGELRGAPPLTVQQTLAESLRERGFRTACIYANGWLRRMPGLDRGFDWFVGAPHPPAGRLVGEWLRKRLLPRSFRGEISDVGPHARHIAAGVLRFVDACEPGPCYVVANFIDAHAPYLPSDDTAQRYEPRGWAPRVAPALVSDDAETVRLLEARYDEEIRELDAVVGALLADLDRRGVLDRSWLFVTSDHGEAFGEHGVTEHGTTLYDEVTRIPLLVQPPRGVELAASQGAVGLLDVAATIAAVAGAPGFGAGRDLRALPPDHAVALEFFGNPSKAASHGADAARPARAVVRGVEKLLERDGREELYRVDLDPGERRDLAAARPAIVAGLRSLLPPLAVAPGVAPAIEGDAQLRALGYVK